MYTDGVVIIEKKKFTIEVATACTQIIYILSNEEEAYNIFMTLILESEKRRNVP